MKAVTMGMRPRRSSTRTRVAVLLGVSALLGWGPDLASVPVASAASCVDGWQQMPAAAPMSSSSGGAASLAGTPAWWVGKSPLKRPQIMRWNNDEWRIVKSPWTGEGALNSVSVASASSAWAVGYIHPLAPRSISARWDGTVWRKVDVPRPGGQATLAGVLALPDGSAWSVGARLQAGQTRPLALRWNGNAWVNMSPAISSNQESGLVGVTRAPGGQVWAAGWLMTNGNSVPWLGQWDGGSWQAAPLPAVDGLGYVTSISFYSATSGWAAGYVQQTDGTYAPLLFHWNGVAWELDTAPWGTDSSVMLTAATVATDGTLVVAGNQMGNIGPEAVMATLKNGNWEVTSAPNDPFPGSWVNEAAPTAAGAWITAGRTSVPQQAFGSAYMSCVGGPSGNLTAARPTGSGSATSLAAADDEDGAPESLATSPTTLANLTTVSPSANGITITDVTSSSGLAMQIRAFSGVVADFNGDGWSDIFINQHTTAPPLLELGGPTGFHAASGSTLTVGDFFDCATADVDGNGGPDLFCPTGRRRGTFMGVDEFRLNVGSTGGTVATQAYGLLDATGRGRSSAFVNLVGDPFPDLFVGTWPMRMDGFPTVNRFYRNADGTHFEPDPEAGLDASDGATCATAADLNGDGNDEIMFCARQPADGLKLGARIYEYDGTTFTDRTTALGISPIYDGEILAANFNDDSRPDIVQLNRGLLRVSLQTPSGRFDASYNLSLTAAESMAVGDVNGDGRADIYVRGDRSQLMLVNNGGGKSFTSIALPPVRAGSASETLAIDYDNNGLTDFLSLNGEYAPGPLQLIAFFP